MRCRCCSSEVVGRSFHFVLEVQIMDYVSRLVQAGIRPDCAVETVTWFRSQGEDRKLEEYTKKCEERAGIL